MTDWPHTLHDAYQSGRQDQAAHDTSHLADLLADLATAHADIAQAWARLGHVTRAQRIARELAAMRALCDQVSAELGRPAGYTYRGGPVDWDTGRPLATPWQANPAAVAA